MQTKITKLTIKGESIPFFLNINALREFSKKHNIKRPSEIGIYFSKLDLKDPDWEVLEALAYMVVCGLEEGARVTSSKNPYDEKDMLQFLSENPDNIITVFNEFSETSQVEQEGK